MYGITEATHTNLLIAFPNFTAKSHKAYVPLNEVEKHATVGSPVYQLMCKSLQM